MDWPTTASLRSALHEREEQKRVSGQIHRDSWREMRRDLRALFEAAELPMRQLGPASQAAGYTGPPTSLSTLSSYLKDVDQPIGTDTVILEGLVAQLLALTRLSRHPAARVWTDTRGWKRRWEVLKDQPQTGGCRPLSLMTAPACGALLAGWDGAGDDVLLSEDAEASWLGHPRLVRLAAVIGELHHLGLPVEAARIAQILRGTAADLFPADAEQLLAARHIAAYWTGEAGDAHAARNETGTLLSDCIAALDAAHPLIHLARLRLAVWEERCGHTTSARRLFRLCVDAPDIPDRLRLLARLGVARSLEDLDAAEAARQLDSLLHDLQDAYGAHHPVVFAARLDAAMARRASGTNPRGTQCIVEGLVAEAVDALGSDHPITLGIRTRYVVIAETAMPDAAETEELLSDVLQDVRRVRGEFHPATFNLRGLQLMHISRRDPHQAYQRVQTLGHQAREHLGDSHPVTLYIQYLEALTVHVCGRADAARTLYDQWLSQATEVLGPHSRQIRMARHALAIAVARTDGTEAARPLYEELLTELTYHLGEDHPETLLTRIGYVIVIRDTVSPYQALLRAEHLLADQIRVLGGDHWTVLLTRSVICDSRRFLEGTAAVLPAYTELLADYVRIYGADHEQTRALREKTDEIGASLERALEGRRFWEHYLANPSLDETRTLVPRAELANLTLDSDGLAAALPLYKKLLPDLERFLPDHPSTLCARHALEAHQRMRGSSSEGERPPDCAVAD